MDHRACFEQLEERRLLAGFELSSLLAGDGSEGFVAKASPTSGSFSNEVSVAASGDVNGDGFADFIVRDNLFNPVDQKGPEHKEIYEGGVFVVYGNNQGGMPEIDLAFLSPAQGFVIHGNPHDLNGRKDSIVQVTADEDLSGDGIADVVAIFPNADPAGRTDAGRVYVLYGDNDWGDTEWPDSIELQNLLPEFGGDGSQGFVLNGVSSNTSLDSIAVQGDVNGDSIADLVVGSWGWNPEDYGQAYVVFGRDVDSNDDGNNDSLFPVESELSALNGSDGFSIPAVTPGDWLGFSVSNGGDMNHDGINDIVVGAPEAAVDQSVRAGKTYVIYGSSSFSAQFALSSLTGTSGFVINGIDGERDGMSGDVSGASVFSGGDFNGDGIDDLAIGAPRAEDSGNEEVGEGYVVFGRDEDTAAFPATLELSALNGTNGFIVSGNDANDSFARHVELADLNGDGLADVVMTAPGGDPNGNADAGETYVVFGVDTDTDNDGTIDNPLSSKFLVADLNGENGVVINGIDAGDSSGGGIANETTIGHGLSTGDFNGDGVTDLAIGSLGAQEAYMLFGSAEFGQTNNVNAAPLAVEDAATTHQDTAKIIDVLANDSDPDGDALTIVAVVDQPSKGTVVLNEDQTITYTPTTGFTGSDSFTYEISDGDKTDQATVTITVRDNLVAPMFVGEISLESRRGGRYRAVFLVHDENNQPLQGVQIEVTFAGQTYGGFTDAQGRFRTSWAKLTAGRSYAADVIDLVFDGYDWDDLADDDEVLLTT